MDIIQAYGQTSRSPLWFPFELDYKIQTSLSSQVKSQMLIFFSSMVSALSSARVAVLQIDSEFDMIN